MESLKKICLIIHLVSEEAIKTESKGASLSWRMEVGMSLNALVQLPLSTSRRNNGGGGGGGGDLLVKHSPFFSTRVIGENQKQKQQKSSSVLVIEAKQKRGMQARQFKKTQMPALPKLEEDGNPKFVIFIRMANVYLWYPFSLVTGGTIAKIMVAAKGNFLGKYIYKDTLSRNIAAVIYKDEKEIQKTALRQHRVLRTCKEFRYGYKLVEGTNLRAALSTSDVIELPTPDQLKTVLDKVKDFFGDAKESFGKLTDLSSSSEESTEASGEKSEVKG